MSRHVATAITAAAFVTILVAGAGAGSTSAPGQLPPVNLTAPTISGTAQVGGSLTAAVGTWDGRRLTYAYQWLRCDSVGAGCSAISGATYATRAASSADLNATLRVVVTATNRNGSAAATSAATAAVVSAPSAPLRHRRRHRRRLRLLCRPLGRPFRQSAEPRNRVRR